MPRVDWIFFSPLGSIGYFPNQPVYSFPFFAPGSIRPGSYDSADDQYVETPGDDIWLDLKLEYVLPLGNARLSGMADYRLKKNFLQSGASGESLSR